MIEIACPNCNTRYQVPPEALGRDGREVACAVCGTQWLARQEPLRPEPVSPPPMSPQQAAAADPAAAARQERHRQMAEIRQMLDQVQGNQGAAGQARRRDVTSMFDDGPPTAPQQAPAADPGYGGYQQPPPARQAPPPQQPYPPQQAYAYAEPQPQPQRQAMPPEPEVDPLRAKLGQTRAEVGDQRRKLLTKHRRRHRRRKFADAQGSGAFRTGLLLVVIVGSVMFGLYRLHPQIIAKVPEAEGPLLRYVQTVDQALVSVRDGVMNLKDGIAEKLKNEG